MALLRKDITIKPDSTIPIEQAITDGITWLEGMQVEEPSNLFYADVFDARSHEIIRIFTQKTQQLYGLPSRLTVFSKTAFELIDQSTLTQLLSNYVTSQQWSNTALQLNELSQLLSGCVSTEQLNELLTRYYTKPYIDQLVSDYNTNITNLNERLDTLGTKEELYHSFELMMMNSDCCQTVKVLKNDLNLLRNDLTYYAKLEDIDRALAELKLNKICLADLVKQQEFHALYDEVDLLTAKVDILEQSLVGLETLQTQHWVDHETVNHYMTELTSQLSLKLDKQTFNETLIYYREELQRALQQLPTIDTRHFVTYEQLIDQLSQVVGQQPCNQWVSKSELNTLKSDLEALIPSTVVIPDVSDKASLTFVYDQLAQLKNHIDSLPVQTIDTSLQNALTTLSQRFDQLLLATSTPSLTESSVIELIQHFLNDLSPTLIHQGMYDDTAVIQEVSNVRQQMGEQKQTLIELFNQLTSLQQSIAMIPIEPVVNNVESIQHVSDLSNQLNDKITTLNDAMEKTQLELEQRVTVDMFYQSLLNLQPTLIQQVTETIIQQPDTVSIDHLKNELTQLIHSKVSMDDLIDQLIHIQPTATTTVDLSPYISAIEVKVMMDGFKGVIQQQIEQLATQAYVNEQLVNIQPYHYDDSAIKDRIGALETLSNQSNETVLPNHLVTFEALYEALNALSLSSNPIDYTAIENTLNYYNQALLTLNERVDAYRVPDLTTYVTLDNIQQYLLDLSPTVIESTASLETVEQSLLTLRQQLTELSEIQEKDKAELFSAITEQLTTILRDVSTTVEVQALQYQLNDLKTQWENITIPSANPEKMDTTHLVTIENFNRQLSELMVRIDSIAPLPFDDSLINQQLTELNNAIVTLSNKANTVSNYVNYEMLYQVLEANTSTDSFSANKVIEIKQQLVDYQTTVHQLESQLSELIVFNESWSMLADQLKELMAYRNYQESLNDTLLKKDDVNSLLTVLPVPKMDYDDSSLKDEMGRLKQQLVNLDTDIRLIGTQSELANQMMLQRIAQITIDQQPMVSEYPVITIDHLLDTQQFNQWKTTVIESLSIRPTFMDLYSIRDNVLTADDVNMIIHQQISDTVMNKLLTLNDKMTYQETVLEAFLQEYHQTVGMLPSLDEVNQTLTQRFSHYLTTYEVNRDFVHTHTLQTALLSMVSHEQLSNALLNKLSQDDLNERLFEFASKRQLNEWGQALESKLLVQTELLDTVSTLSQTQVWLNDSIQFIKSELSNVKLSFERRCEVMALIGTINERLTEYDYQLSIIRAQALKYDRDFSLLTFDIAQLKSQLLSIELIGYDDTWITPELNLIRHALKDIQQFMNQVAQQLATFGIRLDKVEQLINELGVTIQTRYGELLVMIDNTLQQFIPISAVDQALTYVRSDAYQTMIRNSLLEGFETLTW